MKCPRCGFVSFDELVRCKKCGTYFKDPPSTYADAFKEQNRVFQDDEFNNAHPLPQQWSETIKSIKKDLEEIEGKPVDRQSQLMSETEMTSDEHALTEKIRAAQKKAFTGFDISSASKGGFFIRLVAYLIDSIILFFIDRVVLIAGDIIVKKELGTLNQTDTMENNLIFILYYLGTSLLIGSFYFTYCHGVTGQTIGKWICGLRVVKANGEPLGLGRAFLRWLGYFVSAFSFCFGFIWIAFNREKQGWHDKMAGSYVIRI